VSSGLLGIGLAVIAILPVAIDMLERQTTKISMSGSKRRIRNYFVVVSIATLLHAIAAVIALAGMATELLFLYFGALVFCFGGITLLACACGGIFFELLPAFRR